MLINKDYVKLRTLANLHYDYNSFCIKPKTMMEIVEMGYEEFNNKLSMIMLSPLDVFNELSEDFEGKSLIELLIISKEYDFLNMYIDAFNCFISNEIRWTFDDDINVKFENENLEFIDFYVFTEIIKIQNCVMNEKDDEFNVLSERAKKLKEKIMQKRKKVATLKEKKNESGNLNLEDLISILCSKGNGINIFNVYDLNYYQFNNQFNRIRMIDDYEVTIQSLLHGADSEKVKVKHWISKID